MLTPEYELIRGNNSCDNNKVLKELLEWLEAVVFSLVLVVLMFTFIFRVVGVDGDSMVPTLNDGDRVILSNFFYSPKVGDIVVTTQPNSLNKALIKRIIAVEGQKVDIDFTTGDVSVDGKVLEEDYINARTTVQGDVEFPIEIPHGKVFVMGDNRNLSLDSRYRSIGLIDVRYLLGKSVFRIFPFSDFGGIE